MRELVRDEEALLERVRARLGRAVAQRRPRADLRALRDEALDARGDDLPGVLHELAVQHALPELDDTLPDPRAPYFAHFAINGRDYLLGHRAFVDGDVRILDWRTAPLARVFHAYREGDPIEEEVNGRVLEGTMTVRRVVVIRDGTLDQVLTDDEVLARGERGFESRPRATFVARSNEVIGLLDERQRAAIDAEGPLLVTGSAGSGKTIVALHRLARIGARVARVVVPSDGLARLGERILAPIGRARVSTIDRDMRALARDVFGKLPPISDETPGVVVRLKRHPALYRALTPRGGSLRSLRRQLTTLFTDAAFLGRVVDGTDLPRSAIQETVRHTRLQLAERFRTSSITDPSMRDAIDGREITESTPDALAGTIDVDDLPILLYLHGGHRPEVDHLVVDEAEDLSRFELNVLGGRLKEPKSVTIAGDELQRTAAGFDSWEGALAALGVRATTVRLGISYRCPRPIVELAARILRVPLESAREGAPVERFDFPDRAQADLFAIDAARELAQREPRATIAILARDAEGADRIAAPFDGRREATCEPGIDVLDVDAAKGLEFDYVIVPDVSPETYPDDEESRRRLHVAVTRAAQQLWIVGRTPILDQRGASSTAS